MDISRISPVLLSALAAAALLAATTFALRPAAAKPEFTAQTKLACGQCHVNPAGGESLKPFGQRFKDNGNTIK